MGGESFEIQEECLDLVGVTNNNVVGMSDLVNLEGQTECLHAFFDRLLEDDCADFHCSWATHPPDT